MRALLQRVGEARVEVDGRVIGEIGGGLLILICAVEGDGEAEAELLARKIAKLRIFRDAEGKMNRSIADAGGRALVVSQFTLAADLSRGNRPGFSRAAAPELGRELYEHFCRLLAQEGIAVEIGEFGAEMAVSLVNDGPVTIWMDSKDWAKGP
jgi:D-tyrosyl-tRNA(Tyr) deacylase